MNIGKINASFELIIPSRSASFPQETGPSSPSINTGSLPTLLHVYAEAGSNIYNNYSTCEPDDDGPMLKLLSGLLAALLLLHLINVSQPPSKTLLVDFHHFTRRQSNLGKR